jgi:hypothetical protein
MPTILRQNGFRFFIPTLDHPPAHVHVAKDGAEAKFTLVPVVELVKVEGMKMTQVHEAFVITCQHREEFLQAWNTIHENK